ncbi:GNAT family N-acetyltransferase [Rhodococcus sp. IEGM 1366]|uniref:GNAT family N-acetyltransferase n=1 Tax=Rhodococcus sp. IEGM 1366 TaxID=3082223 RepID=UPI002954102E|nr:GNAT family N-acetyltransferase [Rhodococcus sp. IEGM 1366]MDV8070896.1 GNAT family N-acetyltransferase [Rhodococcus sp. IEGM 1366]
MDDSHPPQARPPRPPPRQRQPAAATRGLTVRYLTAGDRHAVQVLHEHMSGHDAHLRFFGPRPKHLEKLAEAICRQNDACLALGAFESAQLVGVANYVITETTTRHISAEIALAVVDNEQEHGIGTLLLRHLGNAAYQHGVTNLTAEILAENDQMLAVIEEQGWSNTLHHQGSLVHFDLTLVSQPEPANIDIPTSTNSRVARALRKGGR